MERMTKRDRGGNARMDCDKCEIRYRENCCSTKLCRNALIDRLAAYEDAEEAGLLVRLPCKVGDTVYAITPLHNSKMIVEGKVGRFSNLGDGLSANVNFYNDKGISGSMFGYVGSDIFATYEEAGAALKEG